MCAFHVKDEQTKKITNNPNNGTPKDGFPLPERQSKIYLQIYSIFLNEYLHSICRMLYNSRCPLTAQGFL